MMLFQKFILSLWAAGVILFFPSPAFAYMGGVCLHPMEQMALFSGGAGKSSGKSSYKSQIKRLNKSLRTIDRRIDKQKNKLKKATEALGNSLSGQLLGDDPDDVADSITDYIQDEQNGWNCQEEGGTGGSVYLYPNFLPGIFGSLLPLLLESTPTYAAPPLPRESREALQKRRLAQQQKTAQANKQKQLELQKQAKQFCERRWGKKEVTKAVPTPVGTKCYCRWDGPSGRSSLLCEQVKKAKGNAKKQQLERCRRKFDDLKVTDVKGAQCFCEQDSMNKRVKCEGVRKRKKEAERRKETVAEKQKRQKEKQKNCAASGGTVKNVTSGRSTIQKCVCGGDGKPDGDWKCSKPKKPNQALEQCKKYTNFESLGKNNVCMCGSFDIDGAKILEPCKDQKKPVKSPNKQCREKYAGLKVVGAKKNGNILDCTCYYNRKKASCENIKNQKLIEKCKEKHGKDFKSLGKNNSCICRWDGPKKSLLCTELEKIQQGAQGRKKAMEICRKRHKKAKITRAVTTGRGTYCYCGGNKLCNTIYVQCKAKHGKKFTHIDSDNDCMCGSDLCKDKELGNKLQKCIDKNRDIFPNGVTIKDDTCMCGQKSCDQLRGILSRKCKQYEGIGYTEFKNGKCMCGNKVCKDKKEGKKSVDARCFKKFPDLVVVESLYAPNRRLQCICLHKGMRIHCGRIKNKPKEESTEPAKTPSPTYQEKYKECKNKYEGKAGIKGVIQYNNDREECICSFHNIVWKGPCNNPPSQTSPSESEADDGEGDTAEDRPIEIPASESEPLAAAETVEDTKKPCKNWQKKKYFRRKGRVKDRAFCSDFASGKKNCRDAFEDIRKEIEKLSKLKKRRKKLEKSLSEWEDKKFDAQFSEDEDDSETEVGGLCIQCLSDLRRATGPSGWQRFGSGLSVALGAGLSIFGLREARRAQNSTNELLALQGMPAENNFGYSLAGLSLGYPFVARGLHGLTHGNTPNFACNRHPSPYPHPYPTYPMF